MKTVVDSIRGCGWRKPGGFYLRSEGLFAPCGRLPIPLTVCPCCGEGIKQSRGFTWITNELLAAEECSRVGNREEGCDGCPLSADNLPEKLGLIWVGAKFYPDPKSWIAEAQAQGVSKRIGQIPKSLVLGKTLIAVAHPKVQIKRPEMGDDPLACEGPAIFATFRPTSIEYVATGEETDEELEAIEKRGVTPVLVEKNETRPFAFEQ